MKHLLTALATLLFAATPTLAGLGTTSNGLIYLKQARCQTGACPVDASITIIPPRRSRIKIYSANAYRSQKSIDGAGDTLPRYAVRTGANAVFSGGLLNLRTKATPQGGVKISGQQIARFNGNWLGSTLICEDPNQGLTFTPLRSEQNINQSTSQAIRMFNAARTCIQSGDTLQTPKYPANILMRQKDPTLPNNYWTTQQTRHILVKFASGSIGFLWVPNANRTQIARLLSQLTDTVNAPVSHAVNLSGGRQAGYIVRTREDPAIVGSMVFAFPVVFLIR